jgi:hypothetical protein
MTSEAEASVHSSSASNSYHTGTAHSSVDPTGELTYSSGNQSNSGCSRVRSQDSGIM